MSYKYLQDKSYYENLYDKQTVSLCRAGEKTVNSVFSEMEKKASKAELVKHQAGWYLWYSIFYFQFVESLAAQRYQDREKAIQEKAGSDQEKDNLLETSRPRKSYFCLRCGKDMALISKEYLPRKKSSSNNWGLTLVLPIVYTLSLIHISEPTRPY